MNWISVKDKFPECDTKVICYGTRIYTNESEELGIFVAIFKETECLVAHKGSWDKEKEGCIRRWFEVVMDHEKSAILLDKLNDVTHWMPLPEEPKEA